MRDRRAVLKFTENGKGMPNTDTHCDSRVCQCCVCFFVCNYISRDLRAIVSRALRMIHTCIYTICAVYDITHSKNQLSARLVCMRIIDTWAYRPKSVRYVCESVYTSFGDSRAWRAFRTAARCAHRIVIFTHTHTHICANLVFLASAKFPTDSVRSCRVFLICWDRFAQ